MDKYRASPEMTEELTSENVAYRARLATAENKLARLRATVEELNGTISIQSAGVARLRAEVERLRLERETWMAAYKAACELGTQRGAEVERLHRRIQEALKGGDLRLLAPCILCGYTGEGFYQPHRHSCAALAPDGISTGD